MALVTVRSRKGPGKAPLSPLDFPQVLGRRRGPEGRSGEAHSLLGSWIGWRMREEGYPSAGAMPLEGEALTDGFKPPLKFEGRKENVAAGARGSELEF